VQTQHAPTAISHEEALRGPHPREFNYLILVHQAGNKGKTLDEYRSDAQNTKDALTDESPASPRAQGFASAWLLFFPSNQSESRFRYLGRQKIDNHWTLVLAFAQSPGSVKSPGQVVFEGKWIPVLYQGVVWIDETDFRIVQLRTDLLEPLSSGLVFLEQTRGFAAILRKQNVVPLF
jgi:hypothetical protein